MPEIAVFQAIIHLELLVYTGINVILFGLLKLDLKVKEFALENMQIKHMP